MKMKSFLNLMNKSFWMKGLNFFLTLIALITAGPVAIAAGAAVEDPTPDAGEPGSQATPDKSTPSGDGTAPDGNGAGKHGTGTGSATGIRQAGLAEEEYDKDIVRYKAPVFVLLNLARTVATQKSVKGYEVPHFRIGASSLKLKTKAAIARAHTISLTNENVDGNLDLAIPGSTLAVCGVSGFVDGSKTKKEGDLQLFVTSNTGDSVTCVAINGEAKTDGQISERLQDYYVPAIPADTTIMISGVAGSESQKVVAPDNSNPTPKTVFLQKEIFNVRITDHYKEIMKKIGWGISDVKEDGLENFSHKAEVSLWTGKQKRFLVKEPKSGQNEYTYTTEGILRQLSNIFGTDTLSYDILVDIMKVEFANNGDSKEAYALCGREKISELLKIDYIKNGVQFTQETTEYGVIVNHIKNNFGTLHVVHAPMLDELEMSDFMVVADLKLARYYHQIKKETTTDNNKLGDDATESSRYTYIESMALALRGFNSMLVGPSAKIAQRNLSTSANPITLESKLPATAAEGTKVVLTEDYTVGTGNEAKTYEKGKVYVYHNNAWALFTGDVTD
jgi:hypothetical protein